MLFHIALSKFLPLFKFKIYGKTVFERKINVNSRYTKIFHTEEWPMKDLAMMLLGVEDRDEGEEPDGCTDILLPVFRDKTSLNACGVKGEYVFYVDMAMSGAYKKECWFKEACNWRHLFTYSIKDGLRVMPGNAMASVGYIEYYPRMKRLCNFPSQ